MTHAIRLQKLLNKYQYKPGTSFHVEDFPKFGDCIVVMVSMALDTDNIQMTFDSRPPKFLEYEALNGPEIRCEAVMKPFSGRFPEYATYYMIERFEKDRKTFEKWMLDGIIHYEVHEIKEFFRTKRGRQPFNPH